MSGEVAGFWSYVHADNAADHGRVLSLAQRLREEYRLQTADDISIFVDRESLEWGSEWRQRISSAIAGTTFFMPVITPSYFRSQECRGELLKFALEANRLGLEQLLMPVYWATVPEPENDPEASADEAIVLVARYQREDLRHVRLEDEQSSTFRKAIARLAEELARRSIALTNDVTITIIPIERASEQDGDDTQPGWLEVVTAGEETFPNLNHVLEKLASETRRVGTLFEEATRRAELSVARNEGTRARLVIAELLAQSLREPAESIERLGHEYAATLATLDPAIHMLLDAAGSANDSPDRTSFLDGLRTLSAAADEALVYLKRLIETSTESAKLSRSLRFPLKLMRTGLQGVLDGRALIDGWGRRAIEIDAN